MKRTIVTLLILMMFCLMPVSMATATTSNMQSVNLIEEQSMQKVNLIGNQQDSITSKATVPVGWMTAQAFNMQHRMMEVQWTINCISPIYQVYVVTTFGDGTTVTQSYNVNPATYTTHNVVQHTFSTPGYHTATVEGFAYTFNGEFWTETPISVHCTLTN